MEYRIEIRIRRDYKTGFDKLTGSNEQHYKDLFTIADFFDDSQFELVLGQLKERFPHPYYSIRVMTVTTKYEEVR